MTIQEQLSAEVINTQLANLAQWIIALSGHFPGSILAKPQAENSGVLTWDNTRIYHYASIRDRLACAIAMNPSGEGLGLRFERTIRQTHRLQTASSGVDIPQSYKLNASILELRMFDEHSLDYIQTTEVGSEITGRSPTTGQSRIVTAVRSSKRDHEEGRLFSLAEVAPYMTHVVGRLHDHIGWRDVDGLRRGHPLLPSSTYRPLYDPVPAIGQ